MVQLPMFQVSLGTFNSLFNRLYNLKRLEICIRNKLFGRLRTKELQPLDEAQFKVNEAQV